MNKAIKVSQRAAEPELEKEVIKVDALTEVTIPITIFASIMRRIPKVEFAVGKQNMIEALQNTYSHETFLAALRQAVDQVEFYDHTDKLVKAYEDFVDGGPGRMSDL